MKLSSAARQNISACFGNLFEHYDTALYGLLSPFIAPLFFPKQDPITALILTYAVIPLGMIARPFGALFFGYLGDTFGRKKALFFSLMGMAIVSVLLAFCPTYQQAGIFAPVFLCLGRVFQNFFAAGETMGGAIYCLENSEEKNHDLMSSFFSASTMAGVILASGGVAFLGMTNTIEESWRSLYLFGAMTAFFGCFLRSHNETDTKNTSFSFKKTFYSFWEYRKEMVLIMFCSGFSYANYSVAFVLLNGIIPLITPFTKVDMASLNTFLLVFDFATLPLFGWISTQISREKLMIYAASSAILFSFPLFFMLSSGSFVSIVLIRMSIVLFGVAFFAPFHAWAQNLVPKAHRYMTISFAYALGTQLLGGPTATFSLWLYQQTGEITTLSLYWVLLGVASFTGLVYRKRVMISTT